MKIATFNINNVNKRLDNLLAWLRRSRPDVACLQELKATDPAFPVTSIEKAGYGAVWRGENRGTALRSSPAVRIPSSPAPRCLATPPTCKAAISRQR